MKFNHDQISDEELLSIKESFFHIYHSFQNEGFLSKDFVGCLFKWGVQLHINEDELKFIDPDYEDQEVVGKEAGLEHLFNLVFMIYLDGVVGDIELEVITKYAKKLGFDSHIVNDLLKTIVTAPFDGYDFKHVKTHLRDMIA
jgi:hypothetical protein